MFVPWFTLFRLYLPYEHFINHYVHTYPYVHWPNVNQKQPVMVPVAHLGALTRPSFRNAQHLSSGKKTQPFVSIYLPNLAPEHQEESKTMPRFWLTGPQCLINLQNLVSCSRRMTRRPRKQLFSCLLCACENQLQAKQNVRNQKAVWNSSQIMTAGTWPVLSEVLSNYPSLWLINLRIQLLSQ